MKWPEFLIFASDATMLGLAGGALLLMSLFAAIGDHRRRKRDDIDAVGLLPWRDIAALSLFGGLILLVTAVPGWIAG